MNDFESVNASFGDHEGIVNYGRNVFGVEVSVFVREVVDGYRVSLRGNGLVNVNEVAGLFGGGGHKDSAGFDSDLDFGTLKDRLIDVLREKVK